MRLILVLLMVWSCNEDDSGVRTEDTADSNVVDERIDPWTVSTSENDKDDTVDTHFVNRRSGYPSDCIVIEAQQELLDKMDEMLVATNSYDEVRKEYKQKLKKSDILCYAKYHNGRRKDNGQKEHRYLISFYHGTSRLQEESSYQVLCFVNNNDSYVCRDIAVKRYNDGKNFVVIEDKDSVGDRGINAEIKALDYYEYLTYDNSKKMLRVPVDDLGHGMRNISPERSQEISQFQKIHLKGHGKKWVQRFGRVTRTITNSLGQLIQENIFSITSNMPFCNTTAGSVSIERRTQGVLKGDPHKDNHKLVSRFKKVSVCNDLFRNPHNGFCSKELKSQEIQVCKLEGRGILIKRAKDDILRVANCEYQPHAKHFYCSGKEPGSDEPPKIYFERYGVFIDMHDTPHAYCPAKLTYVTDSIGCGSCSSHEDDKYDIAKALEARGCEYNTPHYCQYFDDLEANWGGTKINGPNRCDLRYKTCVFRKAGSRFDTPYCSLTLEDQLKKAPDDNLYSENGCSTEFDNGDKCHFKKLSEIDN